MATTTEKEITVADGLGNADASQVLVGATFSSEDGFNLKGKFSPIAENIDYDNTESGVSAENVQDAMDSIAESVSKKLESEVATNFSEAELPVFQQTIDNLQTSVNGLQNDLGGLSFSVNENTLVITNGTHTWNLSSN